MFKYIFFYFRDLADVSNLAVHNDGVNFLLICIDAFSRFLWVVPIKNKTNKMVMLGLKLIFDKGRKPDKLRSDRGLEFTGVQTQRYLKSVGVQHFVSTSDSKACFAERVIKSVKSLMYRYFQQNQTYRYLEVLQDLVTNYNTRPHSALPNSMSPSDVTTKNEPILWKKMYIDTAPVPSGRKKKFKFEIEDLVRLSHLKRVFQRDYQEKWTPEIFIITHRKIREGIPVYKVMDFMKDPIDGYWYGSDLQKVRKNKAEIYKVEKVIRTRKAKNGQRELLIKWAGWPEKFNSWVSETSLENF